MKLAGKVWIVLWFSLLLPSWAFGQDEAAVHPLNVLQDEGKFTYYVNEDEIGVSHSKWNEDGVSKTKAP